MIPKEEMENRLYNLIGYSPAIYSEIKCKPNKEDDLDIVKYCLIVSSAEFDRIFPQVIKAGHYTKNDDLILGYRYNDAILSLCLETEAQLLMNKSRTELISKYQSLNLKKLKKLEKTVKSNEGEIKTLEKKNKK